MIAKSRAAAALIALACASPALAQSDRAALRADYDRLCGASPIATRATCAGLAKDAGIETAQPDGSLDPRIWGIYADLVDRIFVVTDARIPSAFYIMGYSFENGILTSNSTMFVGEISHSSVERTQLAPDGTLRTIGDPSYAVVGPDGELTFYAKPGKLSGGGFRRVAGQIVSQQKLGSKTITYVWRPVQREEVNGLIADWREAKRAGAERRRANSSSFWDGVGAALTGVSQALADTYAEQQASAAAQARFMPPVRSSPPPVAERNPPVVAQAPQARPVYPAISTPPARTVTSPPVSQPAIGGRTAQPTMATAAPQRPTPTSTPAARAEKPSVNDDANRCITGPDLRANATFKGNTAAYITNGCATPIDARICLMRSGGWNCGVSYGIAPQARWSHSSFQATGEVFVDARVSKSDRPLASPPSR